MTAPNRFAPVLRARRAAARVPTTSARAADDSGCAAAWRARVRLDRHRELSALRRTRRASSCTCATSARRTEPRSPPCASCSTCMAPPIRPRPPSICRWTASPGWTTSRAAASTSIWSICAATASRRARPRWTSPPTENAPIVDTDVAVRDVGAAVEHILARRGVEKINLHRLVVGHHASWAATRRATTRRSIGWCCMHRSGCCNTPPLIGGGGPLGAYRTVTKESARKRWYTGVPEAKQKI